MVSDPAALLAPVAEQPRASPELLRRLTDRRVFAQLLADGSLTRAAVATRTGISKPTVSESVRRLIEARLVEETGREVGGRGRAGTCCQVRTDTVAALAVTVGPEGVLADTYDLTGAPVARVESAVTVPVDSDGLAPVLLDTVRAVLERTPGAAHSCVVSLAGPVDRRSGRLIPLPHAPFLVGEFDARRVLSPLAVPVEVDNDVNWAALAEHEHGNATDLEDFVLCYLGAGIGGAVTVGGRVVGGARGLAGELAHVRTAGPDGRSLTLVECFAAWGLLEAGTEAIDVGRVRAVLTGAAPGDQQRRTEIATAVAGAVDTVVALLDPRGVLLGGPWGATPGLLELVAERLVRRNDPELVLRSTALTETPYRDGVRIRAVASARQAVVDAF